MLYRFICKTRYQYLTGIIFCLKNLDEKTNEYVFFSLTKIRNVENVNKNFRIFNIRYCNNIIVVYKKFIITINSHFQN